VSKPADLIPLTNELHEIGRIRVVPIRQENRASLTRLPIGPRGGGAPRAGLGSITA
jgi:hypothetical protein